MTTSGRDDRDGSDAGALWRLAAAAAASREEAAGSLMRGKKTERSGQTELAARKSRRALSRGLAATGGATAKAAKWN
jgi:hypothetical protein